MSSQNSSDKPAAAVRQPSRDRGRARVAALMTAGASVFAERGYEAATMTEVAARAGAAIGSLYQFFPTKALLASALHAEQLSALSAMLDGLGERVAGLPAAELADQLFAGLSAFVASHPAFVALADRRDIDKPHKQASRARLLSQLTGLLSRADPPVTAPRSQAIAMAMLQLIKAAVILAGIDDGPPAEAVTAELALMLRNHLQAAALA